MHYRERGPFEIKPWARFCLYWGIWTVLGLVNAAHAILDVARFRPSTPAWEPFLWEMSSLYTVGLLFPLVRYAVRRVPPLPIGRTFEPRKIFGAVLLHCFFIVPFSL